MPRSGLPHWPSSTRALTLVPPQPCSCPALPGAPVEAVQTQEGAREHQLLSTHSSHHTSRHAAVRCWPLAGQRIRHPSSAWVSKPTPCSHLLLLADRQPILIAATTAHDCTGVGVPHWLPCRSQRCAVLGAQPAQRVADCDPQVWPLLKGSRQRFGIQPAEEELNGHSGW